MKKVVLVIISLVLLSCSSMVENVQRGLEKGPTFAVIPFENNTETPLAGLRVASIAEGVASSKGYNVKRVMAYEQKEYTQEDIMNIINTLKDKNIDYVITGSVNEFRYKAGIDGEPAVSITLRIFSLKEDKWVYVATASRSGWYFQSVSTLAQSILNRIIPTTDVFNR